MPAESPPAITPGAGPAIATASERTGHVTTEQSARIAEYLLSTAALAACVPGMHIFRSCMPRASPNTDPFSVDECEVRTAPETE
jgi:hypothetical protein